MKYSTLLTVAMVAGGLVRPAIAAVGDFQIFNYDLLADGSDDTATTRSLRELQGRLFVPTNYDASQSYPIVMVLHGIGERGNAYSYDNAAQVNGNIDNLLAAAKSRGFFLYAPQSPDASWSTTQVDQAMNMVAQATQTYNINTSKMYVTGLSAGGGGCWTTITRYTDSLAAAVPVCAVAGTRDATKLVGKPIWAYHAVNDSQVGVSYTRNFINAIRTADGNKPNLTFPLNNSTSNPYYSNGSPYYPSWSGTTYYQENNLRYSEYGGGDHWIWGSAYGEAGMYDWLLSQTNPQRALQTGEKVLFDLGSNSAQTSTDSQGRTWNSASGNQEKTVAPAIAFARNTGGLRTGVTLTVSNTFYGVTAGGRTSGSAYPTNVARDGWVVSSGDSGTIMLSGLTPGGAYQLVMFGSETDNDGGLGRVSRYLVGSDYRDLDLVNNATNTAVFDSVMADASGDIQIVVTAAPGTSRFGGLSALEVTAVVPEPVSLGVMGLAGLLLLRRRHA